MTKVLKTVAIGAVIGALTIASGGTSAGLFGSLASSIVTGLGLGAGSIFAGAIAGGLVAGTLGAISSALAPSYSDVQDQAGHKIPVSNTVDTKKIVYGTHRVGGTEIFIDEYDSTAGDDLPNDTLVFAHVVSDREVSGFGQFYLGDKAVNFDGSGNAIGDYNGLLYLKTYDGTQTAADSWLLASNAGWTANHVGHGIAYYVVKAKFDPEKFPYGASEIRNCSINVQGAKVFDPREPGHSISDPSTWEYSVNPALCVYDYLRDEMLGNPVPDAEISLDTVITSANECDEGVAVKGGGTIKRYTLNGVVDSGKTKEQNFNLMLSAMGGRHMYEGGKFHIFAAAPVIATSSIDEQFLTGAAYFPLPPADARYNEVRGTYIDPSEGFEAQEFPAQGDVNAQTDEGVVVQNINLPFTNDHRIAQRLARIRLYEARQATMQLDCLPVGVIYRPNDALAVSWDNFNLSLEPFRVVKQKIVPSKDNPLQVSLELLKEDPEIYDWDAETDERPKVAGPLLNQYTGLEVVTPTNVQVTPVVLTAPDQSQRSTLQVSWNDPGPYIAHTVVDYRKNGTTAWTPGEIALRGDNNITLDLLHSTAWDIRVRHIMANGKTGPEFVFANSTTLAARSSSDAGSVFVDPWINTYDVTGAYGWKNTSSFDYVTGFVKRDGTVRNGFRRNPDATDSYEYRTGKVHRNSLLAGGRIWNERFDTHHKEQIAVTFYGEKHDDNQGRPANGKVTVAIIFYDIDGKFLKESRHLDTIDFDEKVGSVRRRFVAPEGASTGEVHAIFTSHTQGYWYILGSKGVAYAPADAGSALDHADGPTEPNATDGAVQGRNFKDGNGDPVHPVAASEAAGISRTKVFDFDPVDGSFLGFTLQGAQSKTAGGRGFIMADTTTDPQAISPTGLGLDGSYNQYVVIRCRRTVQGPGGAKEYPKLYYKRTGDSNFVDSRSLGGSQTFDGNKWVYVVFDMEGHSGGWSSATIDQIRFDPTHTNSGDTFEVDWLLIGGPTGQRLTSETFDDANHSKTADWAFVEGDNLPSDNADVTNYTDPRVSNGNITVNADGTATYYDGASTVNLGTVTISGLGYGGDLNADQTDYGDNRVANNQIIVNSDGSVSYYNGSSWVNLGNVTIGGLGYSGDLNATRNTGDLADLNSVGTSDIDDEAVNLPSGGSDGSGTVYLDDNSEHEIGSVSITGYGTDKPVKFSARAKLKRTGGASSALATMRLVYGSSDISEEQFEVDGTARMRTMSGMMSGFSGTRTIDLVMVRYAGVDITVYSSDVLILGEVGKT